MIPARKRIYWLVAAIDTQNAGYRVRTLPLVNGLTDRGWEVEVARLGDLPAKLPEIIEEAAVVICAKPSTPEIYLCMKEFKMAGIPIIVDLFDNYFSWSPTLFARQIPMQWLKFVNLADHIFVSTPFLQRIVRRVCGTPVSLITDSVPAILTNPSRLEDKIRESGKWPAGDCVKAVWYGISGNPYFKAGLGDLLDWKHVLLALENELYPKKRLSLTICTNSSPGIAQVLQVFQNSGIDASYQEWSRETCDNLLDSAHLVLLPTNRTGFSLSKTHNRCSDALAKACLILCSPHGPYADIPGAIFASVPDLSETLLNGEIETFSRKIAESSEFLAGEYAFSSIIDHIEATMRALRPVAVEAAETVVVVLGQATNGTAETIRVLDQIAGPRHFLTAGLSDSDTTEARDLALSVGSLARDTVDLTMTPPGYAKLVQTLEENILADWAPSGEGRGFKVGQYRFNLNEGAQSCRVTAPDLVPPVRKIRALQHINQKHKTFQDAWYALHTEVLTRCLLQAGFNELEFASHGEAGWEFFAGEVDRPLHESYENLKQLWTDSRNREYLWGETGAA